MSAFALIVSYGAFYTPTFVQLTLKPILATWLNAEPILLMLRQDPEVARLACVYLKYASWGLPAYTFNLISRFVFLVTSLPPR